MSMIVQLYPNEEFFGFEHGDEYVSTAEVSESQLETLQAQPWLICTELDIDCLKPETSYEVVDIDFSIVGDDSQLYGMLNELIHSYTQ